MADIVPVPKKGGLNLKSNYRQVSILPVVQVFERIMLKQINKYMDNKLLFWVDIKKTTVASIHIYVL